MYFLILFLSTDTTALMTAVPTASHAALANKRLLDPSMQQFSTEEHAKASRFPPHKPRLLPDATVISREPLLEGYLNLKSKPVSQAARFSMSAVGNSKSCFCWSSLQRSSEVSQKFSSLVRKWRDPSKAGFARIVHGDMHEARFQTFSENFHDP